jgi:hypothetical protein
VKAKFSNWIYEKGSWEERVERRVLNTTMGGKRSIMHHSSG